MELLINTLNIKICHNFLYEKSMNKIVIIKDGTGQEKLWYY